MAGTTNPYIAGSAIRNQGSFFGRHDILEWVEQELRNPGTNAVVLFGQRRIGKTSLLLHIQRILPESDFVVTYFDLQDQAMRPLGSVLADLSDAILDRVNLDIKLPDNKEYDETGRIFRTKFLPAIYEKIPEPKRFVILLDEFDVLDVAAEERLTDNAAAKSLLPFLRRLIADETRLVFIFVAGRRPQDLSINFNQTFKTGLSQEVWVLDKESAITLIRRAEDNKTLSFTNQAVERILALTNGHPYLTQLICQRIWERAHRSKPNTTLAIDKGDVDASLPDALQAGGQALQWLWEGLNPAERIYAAALAEISLDGKPITEDKVIQILYEHASRLRTREVELAPRELIKRRILEEVNGGYRFAIELFRLWVKQSRNLQEVKDELDRTDIPALQMYKLGVSLYEEKDWEEAIRSFKDALKRNPKLFQAQLMLGETFFDMEKYDDAVTELEKAYELDKDDSYLPFARALIAQAREREKRGDTEAAISASQRAMQVSPNDKEAKLINYSIQTRMKEDEAIKLFENQKWMDAAKIFNELLKQDLTKDPVKEKEWKHFLDQCRISVLTDLENKGDLFMEAENWVEAEKIFRELSVQKLSNDLPQKKEWKDKLSICTLNLEIQSLYEKGKLALGQERWDEAIKNFASILTKDQDYKDAAYLLNVAHTKKTDIRKSTENIEKKQQPLRSTEKKLKKSDERGNEKQSSIPLKSATLPKKSPVSLELKHTMIIPEKLLTSFSDKFRQIVVWPADLAYMAGAIYGIWLLSAWLWNLAQWWAYILLVLWVLLSVILGFILLISIHFGIGGFQDFGVKCYAVIGEHLAFFTNSNELEILNFRTRAISKLGFEKNVEKLIDLGDNKLLLDNGMIWDIGKNKKEKYIQVESYEHVLDLDATANQAIIYSMSNVSFIDLTTKKRNKILKVKRGYIDSAILSNDKKLIIVATRDGYGDSAISTIEIWSSEGTPIGHSIPECKGYDTSLAISPDDKILAFGSGKNIIIYSIGNGVEIRNISIEMDKDGCSMEFLGKGDLLAVASKSSLALINISNGEILWREQNVYVPNLRFLPDRNELLTITSSWPAKIKIFELKLNDTSK